MSTAIDSSAVMQKPPTPTSTWLRRFLIVMTVLGLVAVAGVVLWLSSLVAMPLTLLLLSSLFAYIMYPAVQRLERRMSTGLAILLVFLGVTVALGMIIFGILATLVKQIGALIVSIRDFRAAQSENQLQTILGPLGGNVTADTIHVSQDQITAALRTFASRVLAFTGSVFTTGIVLVIIVSLTAYLLVYGPRVLEWVRHNLPIKWRGRVTGFLDEVDNIMGGFFRGAIMLACLMGAITGLGAFLLGIPYWLVIALIVFVCEFIPQFGAYISGFLGTLLAFTQGWQIGLTYLIFATILQGFLDAQVLIPRVVGKHTGINPIISTLALLVGLSLLGLLGAVIAIPAAAIAQFLLTAGWRAYRREHPHEFPAEPAKASEAVTLAHAGP